MKYYSETNNKLQFDTTTLICRKILEDKEGLMSYRETELAFLKFLHNNGRTNYGNCNNHYYSKYVKVISEFEEINSVLQLYN